MWNVMCVHSGKQASKRASRRASKHERGRGHRRGGTQASGVRHQASMLHFVSQAMAPGPGKIELR